MADRRLDFGGALHVGGLVLYRQEDRPGRWLLVPHALDVAKRADGTPDFQLDLVRSPSASPAGYGVVDFRVAPIADLETARQQVPGDTVELAHFSGGWLRLLVRDPNAETVSTLLPAIEIASNGLGIVRLSAQLTAEGASLLDRALTEGAVLVDAWAEMQLRGVSPRFPATVSLRASDLIAALGQNTAAKGVATRSDVLKGLAKPGVMSDVPTDLDRAEVVEAVADRLCNQTAGLIPSPDEDFAEWWRFEISKGAVFTWNLQETVEAVRIHVLRFDPIGLVRAAAAGGGLARLVVRRDLPELRTGFLPVTVTANLLERRTPVVSCGVDLAAPARPPHRMVAIRETLELVPPADRADIILRFAADEAPEYGFETFLIVQTGTAIEECRSQPTAHSGATLRLSPGDFAARFIAVTASPQLLAAGTVTAVARWEGGAEQVTLSTDHPSDALAVPAGARDAAVVGRVERNGASIEAAAPLSDDLDLDLPLFREYGTHAIDIEIDFSDGPDLVALDLKPEDAPDTATKTLSFSASRARRTWSWFAASPFAPGYTYRAFRPSPPLEPWSAAQSPFDALRLRARDLAGDRAGAATES